MKKPFVKGGKALTLTAALLCTAVFLGSLMAFGTTAQAETQAEAQAFTPGVAGQITSCKISGDKQNVEIGFSSTGDVTGTDGNIYVFEMQPYEEELGSRSNFIASSPALSAASVSVPLNLGTPQDKLYSRFVLAVFDGTKFIKVSQPHYITNPELIAKNQTPFNDPLTKKGLVIEIDMLNDAFDLGVKHVTTNIAFSQIMGTGIDYSMTERRTILIKAWWTLMTRPSARYLTRE